MPHPSRLLAAALVALAFVLPLRAQTLVEGTVVDAATGMPLPTANIHIEGTYRGTVTNDEGRYALRLDALPAVIVFRFIGYETERRTVNATNDGRLDVALAPVAYELGELVVTGEDPAVNIMRKVIARKQAWRAALETYRAEAYNRFTISNDTGIVSIIESLTQTFWDRERGGKEVVLSRRTTNNLDFDAFLPAALFVTNFYDDDVEVSGYRMIGVTHPEALRHYRFRLEGTRVLDGKTVYDIAVTPKSRLQSAFVGRVAVLDEAYALLEVELRPGEAFLFPPPFERYDVTYRQQFSDFGGDFWLPVDFRAEIEIKIDMGGLIAFPVFRIRQFSRLTNYTVNGPLPDSLYAQKRYLTVDSVAVEVDTLMNRAGMVVPLSARETTAYTTIDSTMTLEKAFAPSGPLARLARINASAEDDEARRRRNRRRNRRGGGDEDGPDRRFGDIVDFMPELWYNRVDAANLALRVTVTPVPRVSVWGMGGYKTGREAATYGAGSEVALGPKRRGHLGVRYRHGVDLRYASASRQRLTNGLGMLIGGTDYFDYYGNEKVTAYAGLTLPRLADLTAELRFNDERHFSVARTTSYDLLGDEELQPLNPAIPEGRLRSVGLRLSVGEGGGPLPITGGNRVEVDLEHSAPGLAASDFDFTRIHVRADFRLPTFFVRRLLPNALDVRLVGATFAGTLPPQRYSIAEASGSLLKSFGTLRTLETRPYEGERLVAAYWEHNFRTSLFEALGLRWFAKEGYNVILHGAHARTWVAADRARALGFPVHVSDGFHHELGLSLSGLFGFLRVDLTRRLDAPGTTVGFGVARIF